MAIFFQRRSAMSLTDSADGANVRVRVTCLGTSVLRTITRDTPLGVSLRDLMSKEELAQMFPPGSNVEISFLNRGEVHLRADEAVKATLGANKMIPGETHVLRKNDVRTLEVGPKVLRLHVLPSHF
ncbi:MAG: hypothetical protein ACD_5C00355G0002 [uncultured bacterium]|nr:MAG: hypothetical protein ACD_5C00355G0002 [uncultured bacterium]